MPEDRVSLPSSVQTVLDTRDIPYNVADSYEAPRSANESVVVKSAILQDGQGRAQMLFPAGKLIDVDSLFRNSDVLPLIAQQELSGVPAIPGWNDLPCYIDESLMSSEKLWLESGRTQRYLVLRNRDFRGLCDSMQVGSFAVDAVSTPQDIVNDEKRILTSVQRFTQLRIKQRLDETLELPPLPETAQKIIKLRADPEADISDLTNIVEIDPSLAAQVISWAASPYYSAPGKIKSVHDAIVRVLGFDMVLNLALGLALGKAMSFQRLNPIQVKEYWRDAVFNAAAVECLVTSIHRQHRPGFGMAYLSGLLHNFGTLILAEVFPPYFNNINRLRSANQHLPAEAAEFHLLSVSGNQIASWLLNNWNMPAEVVNGIRHQNNPAYSGEHHAYALLNFVGRNLLAAKGFGSGFAQEVPDTVYEALHLDRETADIAVSNILESGDDLNAIADALRN
jgi:HD-like signal output (HDOD) protein/prolyl-tRNA editing enzyme YbaK/EbsC (Cys-tRNA(Pro) deacylase)